MSDENQTSENLDGNGGSDKPPLITQEEREKLKQHGRAAMDLDPVPVVKLHDPACRASWLLTDVTPHDHDVVYGFMDLARGYPTQGQFRLSELEAGGLLWREQEPTVPPKVTYGLTGMGRDVHAALKALDAPARRLVEKATDESPARK